MSNKIKKSITAILLVVCVFGLAVLFFANSIIEAKLKSALKNLPETVHFTYSALHVNVFQGMLFLEHPALELSDANTHTVNLKVKLKEFKLENVSYWRFIFKDAIHLDQVLLQDAEISYIKGVSEKESDSSKRVTSSEPKSKFSNAFNKVLKIDNIDLSHATINVFEGSQDSVFLKSENVNVNFSDIYFDAVTAKKNIPFEYTNYRVVTDSLKFNVGNFESIKLHDLELTKSRWVARQFKLQTRYTKQELTKIITKERDHFNVNIDSIYIEHPEFGFTQSQFYFKTDTIIIQKPDIEVYRNKMVADDKTIKPLYSKMLRDLNFDLTLPVLLLREGRIEYEEKVKVGVHAGKITFEDFNATIKNISNTYSLPIKTELDIHTQFMNYAPLHAIWTFDVQNERDEFEFKSEIGMLPASQLNAFTEHNLNIKLEGEFDKIYANIYGNVDQSSIDFNVKYENMKINIFNKKHKKNKFLSSITNLFIHNDSSRSDDGFKKEKGTVTRDKTKSVFNFIWLNFKEGLKLVFIGDGLN